MGIPMERIERVAGVEDPRHGAVGCLRAHLDALQRFAASGEAIGLIVEDDAVFEVDDRWNDVRDIVESDAPWDVFLLSAILRKSGPWRGNVVRALTAYSSAAYIVRDTFVETLRLHLQAALREIDTVGFNHRLALDVYWRPLQKRHTWLLHYPVLVKQRADWSDIRKRHIEYNFE